MATTTYGTVEAVLSQQIESSRGRGVSLHSLWRAAGRPRGKHPRLWIARAYPLVAGLARYLDSLPGASDASQRQPRLVWEWDGDDGETWRIGDLMTHDLVARTYADYLRSDS